MSRTPNHKARMVVDYSRTINKFTILDAYPLPNIGTLVQSMAKYKIFSSLDLRSAYHQVVLHSDDRQYTAFEACGKLYQFTCMPFGLTNAVAAFQRIIDQFIQVNALVGIHAYVDNIYVGGSRRSSMTVIFSSY